MARCLRQTDNWGGLGDDRSRRFHFNGQDKAMGSRRSGQGPCMVPSADRFAKGVFTHSALRTFDYHRWHAPVAGTVIEARLIRGQAYPDVTTIEHGGEKRLAAVEGTGYQFIQMRGLVMLETASGLVACLPVGMAQVSSVVITAEVGKTLRKGEEMGYFQFGGSDFVMVFEAACGMEFSCDVQSHCLQGSTVGHCAAPSVC